MTKRKVKLTRVMLLCMVAVAAAASLIFLWIKQLSPRGMFAVRGMLILLFFGIVALHIIVPISALYHFLYRNRVVVAVLFSAFFVANQFNFSSIGCWDTFVQPGVQSQYAVPVVGTPRATRSDEWLVSVPRKLSAYYVDYGPVNNILRASEASGLSASGLQRGIHVLAQPSEWGYYLFGSAVGLSWYWCYRFIWGILIAFEFSLLLTGGRKVLSLLCAVLLWFSPFNLWWSYVSFLQNGMLAIVAFDKLLGAKKWHLICIWSLIEMSSIAAYVLNLYPAWIVPAGYVFLAFAVWVFIKRRGNWQRYRFIEWAVLVAVVILTAGLTGLYLFRERDYLGAISKTVYPGHRVSFGGFSLNKAFFYLANIFTPFKESILVSNNASEAACFFLAFPLGTLMAIVVFIKKKCRDLLLFMLLLLDVLFILYCTTALPGTIVYISLLSYTTPVRMIDIVGVLNMFLLIYSLGQFELLGRPGWFLTAMLSGVSIIPAWYYSSGILERSTLQTWLVVFAIAVWLLTIVLISKGVSQRFRTTAYVILASLVLISGLRIHPLMRGLDAIYSKPIAVSLEQIRKDDPDAIWIGVDSIGTGNFLAACGCRSYNSTNYIPNLEFWHALDPDGSREEIYNRYAHLVIHLTPDSDTVIHLSQTDSIYLTLSYSDMKQENIKYVLALCKLASTDDVEMNLVVEDKITDMYIYECIYSQ